MDSKVRCRFSDFGLLHAIIKKKRNIQVTIANNGKEAIELFEKQKFDLIFMDLHMPVMDGFEATKRIKELPGVQVPILPMTAAVMQQEREKCTSLGMVDFIEKPIEPDEQTLLQNNEREKAAFLVHRIKGSSGSIGATKLFEAAKQLEQELKLGGSLRSAQVFFEAFQNTLSSLQVFKKSNPPLDLAGL